MPDMEPSDGFGWTMPESLRSGFRIVWGVFFFGLMLLALWRISTAILRWLRRRLTSAGGAEFEPLPGAFRADLLGFLKHIILKLLGIKRLFRPVARGKPVLPEIASMRQIYRQFLRWAAAAGFPRQSSQTPHEYLYELAGMLPEVQEDLALITQQYTRVRYGTWLPTEDELQQIRQSWYNVKQNRLRDRR
jgi:hypothetical protein